ncbi:MAG TPA: HlyD family efflux transporter periplasmic adaptor subunit, partial [Candidatus Peribacteria bacterium]|nr:HlyD family efflux transporter periplasmic adaptor subunit [Candidatus Peribacteria bacterium]
AKKPSRRPMIIGVVAVLGVLACIGAVLYVMHEIQYVFTDKAEIEAPLIALGPTRPGMLKRVYVEAGDIVRASQTMAWVGDETINAQVDGLVVDARGDIGAPYQPGQSVVTMIQPEELRVVARIDEDKGLKDIYVGQKAFFTLDAFGSRQFPGVVSSVSPTKRANDVVFNISDKRETKQFDVKISYDADIGSLFQNGMSARVWIVK